MPTYMEHNTRFVGRIRRAPDQTTMIIVMRDNDQAKERGGALCRHARVAHKLLLYSKIHLS